MKGVCGRENGRFGRTCVLALTVAAGMGAAGLAEAGTTYVVSPTGNDKSPGTLSQPFRTVQRGVDALVAGDRLILRAGRYVGPVLVKQKQGPIVIAAPAGETASIDGYLSVGEVSSGTSFGDRIQVPWEPASRYDPNAHPEEFVSTRTFGENDLVNRGAFLDVDGHTRLITYARLEDLRADNETWERIDSADDARPGPKVFVPCNDAADPTCEALPDCAPYPSCAPPTPNLYKPADYRYPSVYMGPGLRFDKTTGRVHIRLSHTHNEVKGLADYRGEVDPRRVALAIAPREMYALRIESSSHVLIKNVEVRFGGEDTIELDRVTGVTFDHVRIWAGDHAVRMLGSPTHTATDVVFAHCLFDGGVPQWQFRNDLKGGNLYHFLDESTGLIALNPTRSKSADTLLLGAAPDRGTIVEHSEFVNGHDLYLTGTGIRFHHNWICNLNDEALVLDGHPLSDAHIYENLIERSLSGISMAGEVVGGPRYIYRNVFDLREPTAGIRPRNETDRNVWRYGHLFKSNGTDGPLDLFHNTFMVENQTGQATYLHLESRGQVHPRRSFNNVFVAVNAEATADTAITYLPDPNLRYATDGNDYFRFGYASGRPYRYLDYDCGQPANCKGGTFASLDGPALPTLYQSAYFAHSRTAYAPGFEANSLEVDPQFESFTPESASQATDDFRLSAGSPLRGAAVALPSDLAALDPLAGSAGVFDVGALPHGSAPLRVGIDGRRWVGQAY